MMHPTVHLNGTPRERLLEGYMAALEALRAAETALQATGPNGRDYYPSGTEAIKVAQAEHVARLASLERIIADIQTLAETLA